MFYLEHSEQKEQERGQKLFGQLLDAVGLSESPEDVDELCYLPLRITIEKDRVTYRPPVERDWRAAA